MVEVYMSRKKPHPLGTVVYDEIEQRARDKLKDYPGEFSRGKKYRLGAWKYCFKNSARSFKRQ
jgi:hypothetical protein